MAIMPDGEVRDFELPNEPAMGQTLTPQPGNRTFRISECHKSVIDTWEWVITLSR